MIFFCVAINFQHSPYISPSLHILCRPFLCLYAILDLTHSFTSYISSLNRTQSTDVESLESPSSAAHQLIGHTPAYAAPPQQQQSHQPSPTTSNLPAQRNPLLRQSSAGSHQSGGSQQLDDNCSTDSSSFDGAADFKKRRRKLHFPFGKKKNTTQGVAK